TISPRWSTTAAAAASHTMPPTCRPVAAHAASSTAITATFAPTSFAASGTRSAASWMFGRDAEERRSARRRGTVIGAGNLMEAVDMMTMLLDRTLLLHHQRRHHPEHTMIGLGVGEDVAVECPRAR